MTKLTFGKLEMSAVHPLEENRLPPVASMGNKASWMKNKLPQYQFDEVSLHYGYEECFFPYRDQDLYGRELESRELDICTLENDNLSAQFMLEYGGRLWSLYDKNANKELMFKNSVFRVCNLAARNAWYSGGVEWNCGPPSHNPYTCAPLHVAAFTMDDGTPVLRLYQFERIRCVVYQIDFFLPADSKALFCRMKIMHTGDDTIPMWWWSNMAVPMVEGSRVIVDAYDVYTDFNKEFMLEPDVLNCRGVDSTYPTQSPRAASYFWNLRDDGRKFNCYLDKDGYGIAHVSTKRLKGRKLFLFGQGPGGARWQNFLTADDESGSYIELQAGLTLTQGGSISMPPKTTWEFMEAYGPLTADPKKVHGAWADAIDETTRCLEEWVSDTYLEKLLIDTRESVGNRKAELIRQADGFGALEMLRRQKYGEDCVYSYLDFGEVSEQQLNWVHLLENGFFENKAPDSEPCSWMMQDEWVEMMELAAKTADAYNWFTYLQLGAAYFAHKRMDKAKTMLERSLEIEPSCMAMYILAHVARIEGDMIKYAMLCRKAASIKKDNKPLAKAAVKAMLEAEMYKEVIAFYKQMPDDVAAQGRTKLGYAIALVNTGSIDKAEEILNENGGLVVPDIREGDNPLTTLWYDIEAAKAHREGRAFDSFAAKPPYCFDFRMDVEREKSK